MSKAFVGRAIALVGIVCSLLALGLPYAAGSHYVDDGTSFAFLLVLLSLASWFTSEVGRDLLAASFGAAAFGFFLFGWAVAAFDSLGRLGSGAWLGLCAMLIPIGAVVAAPAGEPARARARRNSARGLGLPVCTVALALVVVGIWLDATSGGTSYWNASSSGHAIGIVMLALVVLNVVLIGGPAHVAMTDLGHLDLLVAAVTFGFVETGLVTTAFREFGSLGAGAWIEACAGILLMVGMTMQRSTVTATVPATAPAS